VKPRVCAVCGRAGPTNAASLKVGARAIRFYSHLSCFERARREAIAGRQFWVDDTTVVIHEGKT